MRSRRSPQYRADADDSVLAAAASGGDRRALEMLLERHAELIVAVCRKVTGNRDDALDAAQEAMIAVTRHISHFDGRAAFTTWLYRVASNAAIDELRRRNRRPVSEADPTESLASSHAGSSTESVVTTRLDFDRALAGLLPEYRQAVVLRDLCDYDYAEIAAIVRVPVGTVRSRIARGRQALAAAMTDGSDRSPRTVITDTPTFAGETDDRDLDGARHTTVMESSVPVGNHGVAAFVEGIEPNDDLTDQSDHV